MRIPRIPPGGVAVGLMTIQGPDVPLPRTVGEFRSALEVAFPGWIIETADQELYEEAVRRGRGWLATATQDHLRLQWWAAHRGGG